jgi:hypothetical protein
VIYAEIAGNAEPIVGVERDRTAGAVHRNGIALQDVERRIFDCDISLGSVLCV